MDRLVEPVAILMLLLRLAILSRIMRDLWAGVNCFQYSLIFILPPFHGSNYVLPCKRLRAYGSYLMMDLVDPSLSNNTVCLPGAERPGIGIGSNLSVTSVQ